MDMGDTEGTEREPHQTLSLVEALGRRQQRRLEDLDTSLGATMSHLEEQVLRGLNRVATRLDRVDGRLVGGDARLDEMEERLTDRLESLENSMAELLRRLPAETS